MPIEFKVFIKKTEDKISFLRLLIQQTKGKIFTVIFKTKDNRMRKITCRLGVKAYLKNTSKIDKQSIDIMHDLSTVYDLQKEGYRSINLKTIKSFNCNKKLYTFLDILPKSSKYVQVNMFPIKKLNLTGVQVTDIQFRNKGSAKICSKNYSTSYIQVNYSTSYIQVRLFNHNTTSDLAFVKKYDNLNEQYIYFRQMLKIKSLSTFKYFISILTLLHMLQDKKIKTLMLVKPLISLISENICSYNIEQNIDSSISYPKMNINFILPTLED